MEVEQLPISSLKPAPYNPRRISKHDMAALERSLAEFGAVDPAVVNADGTIIGGHMRVEAAKRLGWTEFPSVRVDLDEEKARLLNLALNRISGEWDDDMLAELIWSLHEADADLPLSGFDEKELDRIIDSVGPTGVEPAIPAPPDEPVTQRGDMWLMGEHRLFCGDATDRGDHSRLLDVPVDLVLTDPPYGVGIDYEGTDDSRDNLRTLIKGFMPLVLNHQAPVLITPGTSQVFLYPEPKWILCWAEPAGANPGPWGFTCWHPVLAYGADPYLKAGRGGRPDTFIGTGEGASSPDHPVAKPLGVWEWLLKRGTTGKGQAVFDPFMGSGTTLVAAERLGRVAYGLELNPAYCDVAVRRWENYTGEKARTEDGRTLPNPVPSSA